MELKGFKAAINRPHSSRGQTSSMISILGTKRDEVEAAVPLALASSSSNNVENVSINCQPPERSKDDISKRPRLVDSYSFNDDVLPLAPLPAKPSRLSGFQTAKGDIVAISDAARRRSSAIFSTESSEIKPRAIESPLIAFDRGVDSENALEKSDVAKPPISLMSSSLINQSQSSGFRTAKGGRVTISEAAREQSSALFREAQSNGASAPISGLGNDTFKALRENDIREPHSKRAVKSSAFATAKGVKVVISESAAKRASFMLRDEPIVKPVSSPLVSNPVDGKDSYRANDETHAFKVLPLETNPVHEKVVSKFTTAKGTAVSVSSSALAKASSLLTSSEQIEELSHQSADSSKLLKPVMNEPELTNAPSLLAESTFVSSYSSSSASSSSPAYTFGPSSEVNLHRSYLLSHCPFVAVDIVTLQSVRRRRRLESLRQINSTNVLSIVFDQFGDFSLPGHEVNSNMVNDVCTRLSSSSLSPELKQWVEWQVIWVLWTLASYERRYPNEYLFHLLHLSNLLSIVSLRYMDYTQSLPSKAVEEFGNSSHMKKKFRNKASQSPLQRCCDIIALVWPIVLCISFSSAPSSSSSSKESTSTFACQVTDGWWWCPAVLDEELLSLYIKNILKDGMKIAVFSASFEKDSSSIYSVIKLSVNAVRKAKDTAKFGFIPNEYLKRGVSLSSIKQDGGTIYGARVRIEHIVPLVTKVKYSSSSITSTHSSSESSRWIMLDAKEHQVLQSIQQRSRDECEESLLHHEDLQLGNLLDYIDCDEPTSKIILDLERGCDGSYLTEEEERAVEITMRRLEGARQKIAAQLLLDNGSHCNHLKMEERFNADVLVSCLHSSRKVWVRLPASTSILDLHASYFITNLKPGPSSTNTLLLSTTPSTSVTPIASISTLKKSDEVNLHFSIIKNNLRSLARSSRPFDEICIDCSCTIFGWEIAEKTTTTTVYNILFTDVSRVILTLKYPIPSLLEGKLSWLRKGVECSIQYLVIQYYDVSNDVLISSRGEHTLIIPNKLSSLVPLDDALYSEELLRFNALCKGKMLYLTSEQMSRSCSRHLYQRVECVIFAAVILDPEQYSKLLIVSLWPHISLDISNSLLSVLFPSTNEISNTLFVADIWTLYQLSIDNESEDEIIFAEEIVVWIQLHKFVDILSASLSSANFKI